MQSLTRSFTRYGHFIYKARTIRTAQPLNMSTTSKLASKPDTPPSESSTPQKNTPLALPEVAHNPTQLDMSNGSTAVKLDHLGPMVVGADGTLSRITNWEGMTDGEKKATLRIIGKRNQERLKTLREKDVEG